MRLSHAEAQALVSARLDGPLDPVAERELNTHLATCDSCRAFNLSAIQLARGLQGMPRLAASPAVTRAVLDEITVPRSGASRLLTLLPQNTLPVATAVAAAVVILFIGAFGVLRLMDDDEPNVIPALVDPTSETNLAQQRAATEAPTEDVQASETVEPTQQVPVTGSDDATETLDVPEGQPTEDVAASTDAATKTGPETTEAVNDQAATEEPVTEAATEDGEQASLRLDDETPAADEGATEPPTDEPTPESTQAPEPTSEPTLEPEPTEIPVEATEVPSEVEDDTALIGPSGQSTARSESPAATEEPPEPTATTEPTSEPTAEPTATTEPTAEPSPTSEPTTEPTATPEPSPTPEPTAEPTTEPTPTEVPMIVPSDKTPVTGNDQTNPETDDGTGAATTEEPTSSGQRIIPTDDEGRSGNDDNQGTEPSIEPADDDAIIGPPGSDEQGGDDDLPSGDDEATAEPDLPQTSTGENDSNTGMGAAGVTIGTAPEYLDLASVPGDPSDPDARLGLASDGQLIYSRNPGRVSLNSNGITLQGLDDATGQVVGACDSSGNCFDISSGSKGDVGGLDTPIGWIGDTVIYERLYGSDLPVEFRAITLDPSTLEPIDDRSLGGGEDDWETLVRPYPVNGGLLVPTQSYWLYITLDGVTPLSGSAGRDTALYRFKPGAGLIGYVAGGSLIVAPLDAPGEPIAQLPFDGYDYDISPDGSQVAVLSGDGISIYDLSGNLVTTIPNPEGISVGSIAWLDQGIVYSDFTNGVLRIVQPW